MNDRDLELAIQHHQGGRLQEAETIYRRILSQDSSHFVALHLLGVLATRTGRGELGVQLISRALLIRPNYADAHNNLGNALAAQRRFPEAIAAFHRSLQLKPDRAEVYYNLGNSYRDLANLPKAIGAYGMALSLNPRYAEAYNNLGNAFKDARLHHQAVAAYKHAIRCNPTYAEAFNNFGNVLSSLGDFDAASESYKDAIATNPRYADPHVNLARVYEYMGQLDEAVSSYLKAIELNPLNAGAFMNLGNIQKERGEIAEAIASYQRAMELMPASPHAHSNLIYARLFQLNGDAFDIRSELLRWNQRYAEPLKNLIEPHWNSREHDRRLRVGYISPDFRTHVVGRNLLELFRHHDRKDFEITAYSQVLQPDAMTAQFQRSVDRWRSIVGVADEQVTAQIREDQIDILVDLTLHMADNRLLVFARKPAPVQVTFAGYPGTTGLPTIDYRLSDPYLDPPGMDESVYCEQTIHLGNSFWSYAPLEDQDLMVNNLPASQAGAVTFGCLNNFCKVNEDVLAMWARVLLQVENSRILLLSKQGSHRNRTVDRLGGFGIDASRIEFVDPLPHREYLKQYHRIDIGLDSFPYGGHTTSLDALWMGVPIVTLVGKSAVSRAGWSQLSNLGLTELAAHTVEEFVQIATELAHDLPRLSELRESLRTRMERSPLMDTPRFAHNIETAYRLMWKNWCDRSGQTEVSPAIEPKLAEARGLHESGRLQEAQKRYQQILAIQPFHGEAAHFSGMAAAQLGQNELAVERLQRAVNLMPEDAECWYSLGYVLKTVGRMEDAFISYGHAIRLQSGHVRARFNLSSALAEVGRLEDAVAGFKALTAVAPEMPEAFNSLGNILSEQGSLEEAIVAYRRAIELRPKYAEAFSNLGNALHHAGLVDDAILMHKKAVELNPDLSAAASILVTTMHYHPAYDSRAISVELRAWNRRHCEPLSGQRLPHLNDRSPDRRLRVGYVSSDFISHASAYFLMPLLSNHDPQEVEVYCYAQVLRPDATTQRMQQLRVQWRSIAGLSDEQAATQIREDQIDILVDLKLHTADNRLLVFARKPAPVQITWLGYPGSTGLSTMDYRLSDPYLDPSGMDESVYSETTIRLPNCFWCYAPLDEEDLQVNSLPRIEAGAVTFGCLNQSWKFTDEALSMWKQILERVAGSRLLLLAPRGNNGNACKRITGALCAGTVDSGRIEFVPRQSHRAYMMQYHRIDIALDSYLCNGHTTSLDALWMGVPLVTRVGHTPVSRAGLSQLSNLNLQELAAKSSDEYVELAIGLANDIPRLKELRATLRQRMESSALMDGPKFARSVEAAYRSTWKKWCPQIT